jgi:hypothetical protein
VLCILNVCCAAAIYAITCIEFELCVPLSQHRTAQGHHNTAQRQHRTASRQYIDCTATSQRHHSGSTQTASHSITQRHTSSHAGIWRVSCLAPVCPWGILLQMSSGTLCYVSFYFILCYVILYHVTMCYDVNGYLSANVLGHAHTHYKSILTPL